ncbi:AB hydrolase superfamily protein [Vanrija pseudolonga]|uniref:AB hydrolase superfamily protein n=1 Tax=Vanrija pseudolonga TaxID=143232 RepID=A0AAF1BI71_9TREE|nr:AB hydrolase superfamily protein [Vanrija pseudolonga]
MPDFLTSQVAMTAGPLVLETFLKHYLTPRKYRKDRNGKDTARVEFMYDEAFNVLKNFLDISTHHTVTALQELSQTRTPSPPWVAVHRCSIPHTTLSQAADYLVEGFGGEEMAYRVAGGVKWWQVRAGKGVEAEWIAMRSEYKEAVELDHKKKSAAKSEGDDDEFLPEMDRLRCILYIHGGAYYWGSINTHRYSIWRYARKINGRCFAVNYRKAPQYPFPCAIQDCLAAWLYLVDPPPGAEHKPVDPKNIVIAGDSAGGGLVLALLQILRDVQGLDLPAGAALISPWSDLTHSFPSILQNTATDVVPPYSFIHKPSSLWPPPPPALTEEMQHGISLKVKEAVSKLRGSQAKPTERAKHLDTGRQTPLSRQVSSTGSIHTADPDAPGKLKAFFQQNRALLEGDKELKSNASRANPAAPWDHLASRSTEGDVAGRDASTLAQCADPLRVQVGKDTIALDTQVQLYATNAQLCHPWVSPVLGYLGGLPPLYVMCGDNEVLRDEIIYLAHKAAHPEKHPVREDVKKLLPSLQGIEDKYGPTDVHLQVYDGVGHDLPLFSMTKPARGTYRAIATFVRRVTPRNRASSSPVTTSGDVTPEGERRFFNGTEEVDSPQVATDSSTPANAPFAAEASATQQQAIPGDDLARQLEDLSTQDTAGRTDRRSKRTSIMMPALKPVDTSSATSPLSPSPLSATSRRSVWRHSTFFAGSGTATPADKAAPVKEVPANVAGPRFELQKGKREKAKPGEAGYSGVYAGANPFTDHMIRERVDFDGVCRPLEPESELGAMTMPADEIGMIKAGPALRYAEGQSIWDHKYRRQRRKVAKRREHNLATAKSRDLSHILKHWENRASQLTPEELAAIRKDAEESSRSRQAASTSAEVESDTSPGSSSDEPGGHAVHRASTVPDETWYWQWALHNEAPPPSAIVSRRDLPEGRKLALMADRIESKDGSGSFTLPIWVALNSFFSDASDRKKVHDGMRNAKKAADAKHGSKTEA